MMTKNWISRILAAALLAESGCGQRQKASPPTIIKGVKVNLAKFRQTFAGAGQNMKAGAVRVSRAVRYGQYARGLAELETLAASPGLTDLHKKVAVDVLGQLKQVVQSLPGRTSSVIPESEATSTNARRPGGAAIGPSGASVI
jgi:hypothetical protein